MYPPVQGEIFDILVSEGMLVEEEMLLLTMKNGTAEESLIEIKSSHTGIVESVDAKIGQIVNEAEDTELMRISMLEKTYEAIFTYKEDPGYITFGSTTTVSVNNINYSGSVINIKDLSDGSKEVTVSFVNNTGISIKNNENAQMIIEYKSEPGQLLISNQSINDNYGKPFVYVLDRRLGAFGEEYFVERYPIDIIDKDSTYSAISNTDLMARSIVIDSSRELTDKMKVRLADGE